MSLYESIPIVQNFFHFTYITNDGMAFGIDFPFGYLIFSAVSVLLTVFLFFYLINIKRSLQQLHHRLEHEVEVDAVGYLVRELQCEAEQHLLLGVLLGHGRQQRPRRLSPPQAERGAWITLCCAEYGVSGADSRWRLQRVLLSALVPSKSSLEKWPLETG